MKDSTAWTTNKELQFIEFMASDKPRGEGKYILNCQEKITRLQGWLNTYKERKHLVGVDYGKCAKLANKLIKELQ